MYWLQTDNFGNLYYETGVKLRDNYVLQQYTSINDKNGNEIYEGDIVEYQFDSGENGIETDRGEVFFAEGIFYFDRGRSFAANDLNFRIDSLKIVGNIYNICHQQDEEQLK